MSESNDSNKTPRKNTPSIHKKAPVSSKREPLSNDDKQQHIEEIKIAQPGIVTHHSKKWSHYLFDFIMLFLAVTAGFFVDNRREIYMERQRTNQFSKQLLADLRLDSILFENRNRDIESLQTGFDKLVTMLTQETGASDRQLMETMLPLTFVFDLPATTTTYNQMKSSGALRYIENQQLTTHLQDYYDVLLPRSMNIAKVSLDYYAQTINPFYLKHIRVQDYDSFNDTLINKNPVIIERTNKTDQELANIMGSYRSLLKIQVITMNNPALSKIKETIQLLKDEYKVD
jgi:hypothetical protein